MSTGSISQLLTSFKTELARPNHFDVFVPLPDGLKIYGDFKSSELTLRCEATELPGRTLQTAPMKVYGIEEKFPYLTSYTDITLTFIVTDTMVEKKIFESWINFIHPSSTFNFKYKNEYAKDIVITQYDLKKNPSYTIRLINAYPVATNQLDLNWSSDGYHKLTVSFVFDKWEDMSGESVDALQLEISNEQSNISNLKINQLIYQGEDLIPLKGSDYRFLRQ